MCGLHSDRTESVHEAPAQITDNSLGEHCAAWDGIQLSR